jgi:peptide deformylase
MFDGIKSKLLIKAMTPSKETGIKKPVFSHGQAVKDAPDYSVALGADGIAQKLQIEAVLQVLHIPDERLRKVAAPVKEVNAETQRIIDDMFDTMYAEEGIGLAATQVDIHQRIIVIDVSENREGRLVLINPELLEKSGETGIEEGCLSIPEQRALVPRAEKIKIRALDRDGKPFELEADDLLAICIQHEMDHLVGKLFIDYLSPMKQQRIRQKVEKLDRLRARA